jgi:hypothetical protein
MVPVGIKSVFVFLNVQFFLLWVNDFGREIFLLDRLFSLLALSYHSVLLKLLKKFFFFLGNIDVGVFKGVHFNVDVGQIPKLALQLPKQSRDQVSMLKRDLVNQLLVCRVSVLADAQFSVFVRYDDPVKLLSLENGELVCRNALGSGLDEQLVPHSELGLDLLWFVESQQVPLGHDANPVCKLVGFFEVLRTHDDRPSNFDALDEFPGLSSGLHV